MALPVADAVGRLPGANPEAGDDDPLELLVQPDRRSSIHSFHQTLHELLGSEDVDLQVIAVRACALLPDNLYRDIRAVFHQYLREKASPAMVREVLALLLTREHTNPERVAEDLGVVLERGSRPGARVEWRVLDVLCRFGRLDGRTADAVWTFPRELCTDPVRCLRREPDPRDAVPSGCGGEHCLWSWLVNLNPNSASSHVNQAVRLIDALTEHRSEWTAERMRELLAPPERHRSRAQAALQRVAVIHRRTGDPEWDALFPVAARIAQRLGTDRGPLAGAETSRGRERLRQHVGPYADGGVPRRGHGRPPRRRGTPPQNPAGGTPVACGPAAGEGMRTGAAAPLPRSPPPLALTCGGRPLRTRGRTRLRLRRSRHEGGPLQHKQPSSQASASRETARLAVPDFCPRTKVGGNSHTDPPSAHAHPPPPNHPPGPACQRPDFC
ncbi:hypothetical protein ACFXPI_35230, partial [Streptomyces sp. NPDC059104]